ncbi:nucleoside-triphosphate--adenylate kinase [Marivirga tractuosa]|uniref:Nucleoside-triphosphate--adenylate kinase n=1 Tax=Marivirga tractuosa (strain ATCC 23168 / DSM 4126 / NBRC 15989 / NCIMB 1408 / VKM B-1430 / H-43) TaxID=643867 RepID=E4TLW9_MARTH|nr:nucleoside-triphosphate--adenylate kinase [Marivirga tractuosa]ADR20260.1 nucleoside-triphosphate--adenylate kinase [Marivirga tractuosa DSM 4126]
MKLLLFYGPPSINLIEKVRNIISYNTIIINTVDLLREQLIIEKELSQQIIEGKTIPNSKIIELLWGAIKIKSKKNIENCLVFGFPLNIEQLKSCKYLYSVSNIDDIYLFFLVKMYLRLKMI